MRRALLITLSLTAALVAPAGASAAQDSHVFVVVMENKEYGEVIGNGAAPYLNRLANRYASATRMYGIRHPSLPNYLGALGGSTFGVSSNCTGCDGIRAQSLAGQLDDRDVSWRAYVEGMPSPCFRGAQAGRYVKKHNPFAYFRDGYASPCRVVPASRLAGHLKGGSLADFNWIVPDLCHGTHDCGVRVGDDYLSRLLPSLLRETGPHGFVVVTYDEGTSNAGCCRVANGGRMPTVFAGPDVRRGADVSTPFTLYSLLRTLEDVFGAPHLRLAGCDCSTPMNRMFQANRLPRLPERPPGAVTLFGGKISAVNSFSLSWTGPAGQKTAIARAHVEICNGARACSVTVHRLAPGQRSLGGVTVPGPGHYTARVWLEDAQGSADRANRSNPVELVFDQTPPSVSLVRAEDDGSRTVHFRMADEPAGVDPDTVAGAASADGRSWTPLRGGSFDGAGAYTAEIPEGLGEGEMRVRVLLRDRAGNESRLGYDQPAKLVVDVTPPHPIRLASDQVRNRNQFTLSWVPDPADRANEPRRIHVRLCAERNPGLCSEIASEVAPGQRSLEELALPDEGRFRAQAWLEDRYRNASPANASNAIKLVYDATPPAGAFDPPRERDIRVAVSDPGEGSGPAACRIEAQRSGESSFRAVSGSGLEAGGGGCRGRLGESAFGPGLYVLRAVLRDGAGNETTVDRNQAGERATTFIRFPTSLAINAPRGPVAYGAPASVDVRLADARGPIGGVEVEVTVRVETPGASAERRLAVTDGAGLVHVALPPGPNRRVSFRYRGDGGRRGAEREALVRTAAATTLERRSARRLAGRLLGAEGEPTRTVISLEVRHGGAWRPAARARTSSSRRWALSLPSRFKGRVTARVAVRPAPRYPYAPSRTRSVRLG